MTRIFQRPIKRVVVKLGSSQIADGKMHLKSAQLAALAAQISALRKKGIETVLVSSGAIALGMGELGESKRPSPLEDLQARAAIGQALLMRAYSELFKALGLKCAQVLLTWEDFDNRARYLNACRTLEAILKEGVVPVINENDTISTEEIKFGDNDKLSALVASLISADLLVILSDVDGLYDTNKKVYDQISEITAEIEGVAGGTKNKNMAKGGMATKIEAVKIATQSHVPCVIAGGATDNVLVRLVDGEKLGTLFVQKETKLLAREHWIAFGAKPKGVLVVDEGAKKALLAGKSLLLPGIKSFSGHFKADEVVTVADEQGVSLARGVINYSTSDLHKAGDQKGKTEVIHRDHLVLTRN